MRTAEVHCDRNDDDRTDQYDCNAQHTVFGVNTNGAIACWHRSHWWVFMPHADRWRCVQRNGIRIGDNRHRNGEWSMINGMIYVSLLSIVDPFQYEIFVRSDMIGPRSYRAGYRAPFTLATFWCIFPEDCWPNGMAANTCWSLLRCPPPY